MHRYHIKLMVAHPFYPCNYICSVPVLPDDWYPICHHILVTCRSRYFNYNLGTYMCYNIDREKDARHSAVALASFLIEPVSLANEAQHPLQ